MKDLCIRVLKEQNWQNKYTFYKGDLLSWLTLNSLSSPTIPFCMMKRLRTQQLFSVPTQIPQQYQSGAEMLEDSQRVVTLQSMLESQNKQQKQNKQKSWVLMSVKESSSGTNSIGDVFSSKELRQASKQFFQQTVGLPSESGIYSSEDLPLQ